VLKHFLRDLKLEHEFCHRLCELLSIWTTASKAIPIYQGHGIPQGPLSSGLLSECVLRHFDDHAPASRTIRYFRYVDDIRLFAKNEKEIRRRLVLLDRISKEIGLFPQSSKIDIHRVRDIESEIKTISHLCTTEIPMSTTAHSNLQRAIIIGTGPGGGKLAFKLAPSGKNIPLSG
jgi:hypothetical protein